MLSIRSRAGVAFTVTAVSGQTRSSPPRRRCTLAERAPAVTVEPPSRRVPPPSSTTDPCTLASLAYTSPTTSPSMESACPTREACCAASSVQETNSPIVRERQRGNMRKARVSYCNAPDEQALQLKEILQQLLAILGQHAFGMKLHAFDGKALVPQAHDHAAAILLLGTRGDLQVLR